MRKVFSFKKLSVKIVGAFVLCAVICAAFFGLNANKNSKTAEVTNAYTMANTANIVSALVEDTSTLDERFDLRDSYPIMIENQTTTELCWIYSSLKALETSIMVQAGEYYNFSEVAVAYTAYKRGIRSTLNSTGRYQDFIDTALNYGLVYEAEFGNGHYEDINDENEDYYEYVLNYLDRSVTDNVQPVALYADDTYRTLNYDERLVLIKKYIKTYGGLFAGLNAGVIYSSGVNIYEDNPNKPGDDSYVYIRNSHAVCLVGWDDRYGFLALNSWGVEEPKSYQTFYIPFNYIDMHNTINGFVYNDANRDVKTENSSAAEFSETVLDGEVVLDNVFTYGENLILTYTVSEDVNFDNVLVNVYKGEELVTKNFKFSYKDASRKIEVSLKENYTGFVGGTYILKFYEDKTFVESKNFYIFTGTEISYFRLQKKDNAATVDSVLLMNSFANAINSETYYISSGDSYKLLFYLTPLNKWANTNESLAFGVGELYKYTYDGNDYKKEATGVTFGHEKGILKDLSNCYVINIPELNDYTNCKLEFTITIVSTVYQSLTREYVITLFASTSASTKTTDAKIVHYDLDGGLNSPYNVKRLPLSGRDSSVQSFELFEPTKIGYKFVGWYRAKNYTGKEVQTLNGYSAEDVYLYARWEQDTTEYFKTSLFIKDLLDYDGEKKPISTDLVYGDKIILDYKFEVLDELNKYNFSSVYYLYVDGDQVSRIDLGKASTNKIFEFDLNTLTAGKHVITITAVVIISHSLSITKNQTVTLNVNQKNIEFNFAELEFVYDATSHKPSIGVEEGAFYEEDLQSRLPEEMFEVSDVSAIDVGKYVFEVLGIDNENYKINGTSTCTIEILPKPVTIEWVELSKIYNGNVQLPDYEIIGIVDGDVLTAKLNAESFKNVGDYVVNTNLIKLSNKNYTLSVEGSEVFKITPASLVVKINDVKERVQIAPSNRRKNFEEIIKSKKLYAIEGRLYDLESDLNLEFYSEGLALEKSGTYTITGTYNNPNYLVTFENGEYLLSGSYMVTYKLPNGEEYIEYVNEGEDPKGIDDSVYKKPLFGKIEYSEALVNNYDDMYIDVIETDYTWIVISSAIVVAFVVIYLVMTHKIRRNKVS